MFGLGSFLGVVATTLIRKPNRPPGPSPLNSTSNFGLTWSSTSRKKVQLPRNATSSFGMNVPFLDIRKHFWVLGPTYFDSASNFSPRTVCPVLSG